MHKFPNIDGYRLDTLLGQGGQGAVFGGKRLSDDRKVAIKVLHDDFGNWQNLALARFHREIAVSKNFAHANVIRILDGGLVKESRMPFLVMDYLEGESLQSRALNDSLTADELLPIFEELAEALEYVHSQGLIHRDVKPANVWVCNDGRVVLLDFGLCFVMDKTRLTITGHIVGTVVTMAPEQIHSREIGPYSDIYSLGATMYWAATGEPPYRPEQLLLIGTDELYRRVKPPSQLVPAFPQGLSRIIMKALHNSPEMRYQSARELKAALLQIKEGGDDAVFGSYTFDERETVALPSEPEPIQRDYRPLIILVLLCFFAFFKLTWSAKNTPPSGLSKVSYDLTGEYKELLQKKSWHDKELIDFGKKVIAADRADKFDVRHGKEDPFVVGCYSIIKELSVAARKSKGRRGPSIELSKFTSVERLFPAAQLYVRLFDHLGKKTISSPNERFLRDFILENHLAARDRLVIDRLKKLLDDVTSMKERLIVEFRLAEALYLSAAERQSRQEDNQPQQNLQEALWLISPAVERFCEGRLHELLGNENHDELLVRYVEILGGLRREESKAALRKLVTKVDESGDLEPTTKARIYYQGARLMLSPIGHSNETPQKVFEEGIGLAKKALKLAPGEHRAEMLLDLLSHSLRYGRYEDLKKGMGGVSASDFPLRQRYRFYLIEAENGRRCSDLNEALKNIKNAVKVAPLGERKYIDLRRRQYEMEIGAVLGIGKK